MGKCFCPTRLPECQVKSCPWPDIRQAYRKKLFAGLRKEGYSQAELDHLFSSMVLLSITYGLPVYGASEVELTAMQCFLDILLNLFLSSTF